VLFYGFAFSAEQPINIA